MFDSDGLEGADGTVWVLALDRDDQADHPLEFRRLAQK